MLSSLSIKFAGPRYNLVSMRTITFLNKGSRIRGIKRDPESYMKNPTGLEYNSFKKETYQDKIRNSLQFDKFNIQLSDEVILQCLTHKSFAHGHVPYNEKLHLLGSQYLKLRSSLYSLQNGNEQNSINGFDFNNLGDLKNKTLTSKESLTEVTKKAGIDNLVFWKMRDVSQSSMYNGESKVLSTVLNSIVGAILTMNGSEIAAKYVDDFLLNKNNELSLLNVTVTTE